LFAKSDEQRECAFVGLTAARNEYSKALLAAAAARDKIFVHARETEVEHLSWSKTIKIGKIMQRFLIRILLRNFSVTKQHETAAFAWIFIGKNDFLRP